MSSHLAIVTSIHNAHLPLAFPERKRDRLERRHGAEQYIQARDADGGDRREPEQRLGDEVLKWPEGERAVVPRVGTHE